MLISIFANINFYTIYLLSINGEKMKTVSIFAIFGAVVMLSMAFVGPVTAKECNVVQILEERLSKIKGNDISLYEILPAYSWPVSLLEIVFVAIVLWLMWR